MSVTVIEDQRGIAVYNAKQSLKNLLKDLPVTIAEDASVRFGAHPSEETMLAFGERMVASSKASSVFHNFTIGDWWNALGEEDKSYGYRAKIVKKMAKGNIILANKMNKRFRDLGTVASLWPAVIREYDKSWAYHRHRDIRKMNADASAYIIPTESVYASYVGSPQIRLPMDIGIDMVSIDVPDPLSGNVSTIEFDPKDVTRTVSRLKNIKSIAEDFKNEQAFRNIV